ncbi:sugar ABC transporter permease [Oceanispirochaeta crateris]|uniref:Sugar ABC transporter permease n=1 Tax=Oceanispirochaeta crateris TaxID=2518645 RepID=A0A5C1QNR0_9SPIO|nr:sugar ABC transporter permease [Oceanispirochaeta crateris]QEN09167.1 sugar ABC transporter permease [Oceanispirochaeta crateris]
MVKEKNRKNLIEKEKRLSFYCFMSLWILGFAIFQLIPIFWGFRVSLTNQMAFSVQTKFVGFANYITVFQDPTIFVSITYTLLFALLTTILQVLIGFILAMLVEKYFIMQSFFRVMFYLPYVIPIVATGWIFRVFLDKNVGTLNIFLTQIHLISENVSWLGEYGLLSILMANFWRVGWSMLIFIGGLSTIPRDLYDAASVDGAGYVKKMMIITIPFVSPFIAFQMVVSFIYGMQVFILPYILNPAAIRGAQVTAEAPPKETFFILAKGYDLIFNKGRLAYGFAVLWVTFIIVLMFSLIYTRMVKKMTYSEVE